MRKIRQCDIPRLSEVFNGGSKKFVLGYSYLHNSGFHPCDVVEGGVYDVVDYLKRHSLDGGITHLEIHYTPTCVLLEGVRGVYTMWHIEIICCDPEHEDAIQAQLDCNGHITSQLMSKILCDYATADGILNSKYESFLKED